MSRDAALMVGFHSRQMLRNSFFVQLIVVTPVSFVAVKALVAYGLGAPLGDQVWFEAGAAGMWSLTTMSAGMIGFQRFQGTLPLLAVSPHGAARIFVPLVASTACSGLLCFPVAVLAVLVCGGQVGWSTSLLMLLSVALFAVGCVAAALTIAVFFVLTRHAIVYEALLVIPVWMVSGIVTSLDSSPVYLRWLSVLSPLTGPVATVRALLDDADPSLVWLGLSACATVFWLLVARLGFRDALDRARSRGTLALL